MTSRLSNLGPPDSMCRADVLSFCNGLMLCGICGVLKANTRIDWTNMSMKQTMNSTDNLDLLLSIQSHSLTKEESIGPFSRFQRNP